MRPPPPRAQFVDLRGDELLAGAGLSQQQHRRIGGRHLPGLFQHAADGRHSGRRCRWCIAARGSPGALQVMVLFLVVAHTHPRSSLAVDASSWQLFRRR